MSEIEQQPDVAALTVQLLSAYLVNNSVASENLADLIKSTKAALTDDGRFQAEAASTPTYTPAVSVRKSLASSDHILSLIDGKPYKTLKRHLATHGLTPQQYRERYNLPASYPIVAPGFAAQRRAIAERIGLGRRKPAAASAKPADKGAPAKALRKASTPKAAAPVKAAAKIASAKRAAKASEATGSTAKAAAPAKTATAPSRKKAAKPKAAAKPANAKVKVSKRQSSAGQTVNASPSDGS